MKIFFAATLLAFASAAVAQVPAAPAAAPAVLPPPVVAPAAKPATPAEAGKAAMPAKTRKLKAAKAAAPNANLVAYKTSTGKTINYDCSKKGNLTKTACKK